MRFGILAYETDPELFQFLSRAFHQVQFVSNLDSLSHFNELGAIVIGGASLLKKKDGLNWIKEAKARCPHGKFIVLADSTSQPHPEHHSKEIIQAFRNGALDYIELGESNASELMIIQAVERGLGLLQSEFKKLDQVHKLKKRIQKLEGKTEDRLWFPSRSQAMAELNEKLLHLQRAAVQGEAEGPVFILGEMKAEAEALGRKVHLRSRHCKGPWLTLNCHELQNSELELELFGNEKAHSGGMNPQGFGLFELGEGGTLFLYGISKISMELQDKIYRALETRHFFRIGGASALKLNCRLIVADSQPLESRAKEGKFRQDFFEKLSEAVLKIPSLSEHREDVVSIATELAERRFHAIGKAFEGFTQEAKDVLTHYVWPGGIAELDQVVARVAWTMNRGGRVGPEILGLELPREQTHIVDLGSKLPPSSEIPPSGKVLQGSLTHLKKKYCDRFEREYLVSVLSRYHGNVSAAARDAKLDRSNFLRLLRKYRIHSEDFRKNNLMRKAA